MLSVLAERVLHEAHGIHDLSAGAAVRLIISRVPKLFDAVLVNENKDHLEDVSVEIIRLLVVANENMRPGVRFSQSPEYLEALQKYQRRSAAAESDGGARELIAR